MLNFKDNKKGKNVRKYNKTDVFRGFGTNGF